MTLSARGAIRAEVVNNMTDEERRALIAKAEEVFDNGQSVEPGDFEEHVGEILSARASSDDQDEEDWG